MFFLGFLPLELSGYIVKTMQGDIYEDIKGGHIIKNKDNTTEAEEQKGFLILVSSFIKEEVDELTLRLNRIPLYSILNILLIVYVGYYLLRIFISAFALAHNGYSADWLSFSLPLSFIYLVSFFVSSKTKKN